MAPLLPLPAVLVLLSITADSLLHGLFGPALCGSQRSAHPGLPIRCPGHGDHAFGSPRPPQLDNVPVTTPTARSHAHGPFAHSPRITSPSDARPRSLSIGHCPCSRQAATSPDGPRPRHGSAVPSPHCSRLVVTFPSPPHVPLVKSPSSHEPIRTYARDALF